MTKEELRNKYMGDNIISEPVKDCARCGGTGEIVNKNNRAISCTCVWLREDSQRMEIMQQI